MDPSSDSLFKQKIETIAKIKSLDLTKVEYFEIEEHLKIIFNRHFLKSQITDQSWVLYRVIKFQKKPLRYCDIIYPPIDKAKINRASNSREQMFYCTTNKKAIFYELEVQPGDTLIISTWVSQQPLLLSHIGYTESNLKDLSASDSTPLFNPGKEQYNNEEIQYIDDFLSKTFCQPIKDITTYKLTISIAKYLLSDINGNNFINYNGFDGLFYPTIRFNANANNIALKPYVIDQKKLSFDRVEFIEIIEYKDDKYKYKIKDIGESTSEDLLLWKNLQHSWTVDDESDELYFVDDVAYNALGEIIPPV